VIRAQAPVAEVSEAEGRSRLDARLRDPDYAPTRALYAERGYSVDARVVRPKVASVAWLRPRMRG
jgi:hypothetical protein